MPPSKNRSDGLTRVWQRRGPLACALLPLGALFWLLVAARRQLYRLGWLHAERFPVPVVVVGNLVAGGAGKTPLTLWLARHLRAAGRRPGIVSRGYGRADGTVRNVGAGATARLAGDEPVLLARRSGCPVVVGADRVAAARQLLHTHPECDVILCDDGLQHLRLARDVEIVVVDRRGLMNGWPLPAGPMREPACRLSSVDALVFHDSEALRKTLQIAGVPTFSMHLTGAVFYRIDDAQVRATVDTLAGLRLHAFAGIGEPQRFFDHLSGLGLTFVAHAFPDHHAYTQDDLSVAGDVLLMTEKDALKCRGLASLPIWVLPVEAQIEPDLARFVLEKIDGSASA